MSLLNTSEFTNYEKAVVTGHTVLNFFKKYGTNRMPAVFYQSKAREYVIDFMPDGGYDESLDYTIHIRIRVQWITEREFCDIYFVPISEKYPVLTYPKIDLGFNIVRSIFPENHGEPLTLNFVLNKVNNELIRRTTNQ